MNTLACGAGAVSKGHQSEDAARSAAAPSCCRSLPHTRKTRARGGVHSGLCPSFSSATRHSVGTAFLKAYQATSLVAARGWFMPVATLESSGESFLNIDHP